jgi:hypothetical protein
MTFPNNDTSTCGGSRQYMIDELVSETIADRIDEGWRPGHVCKTRGEK